MSCGTVDELCARIDLAALSAGIMHPVVANYRRWAIESAIVDLALRQAGVSLADVLGLQPQPVSFVVSPRFRGVAQLRRLLAREPTTRLKLDPRRDWTKEQIGELADLAAVDVLDFKGTYPGTSVYQSPDVRLYRDLLQAFPRAWIEDPALTSETTPLFEEHRDRIAWDEPVHVLADLDRLDPLAAVNIKPSRLGSFAALFATLDRCRAIGLTLYGGGQSEIGPGRGQIQLLAALFYPDGPNDVAPIGCDDEDPAGDLAGAALVQPAPVSGFRWTE